MKEHLSVLIDGEATQLERERVLRELQSDPSLRHTWERYHLARTAMRRELEMIASPGLADRIQQRLLEESPASSATWYRRPRLLRLGAGLAIAASVATVAILNLSPVLLPSTAPLAKSIPGAPGKSPTAVARQTQTEQQRALNPYLVHHGEFAPAPGMNGMLSYVRVVGHDSGSAAAGSNGSE
jgi:sigma-E factor negative regulatory protein RseA